MQSVVSAVWFVLWAGIVAGQTGFIPRTATRTAFEARISTLHLSPGFTTTVRLPEPVSSVIVGDSNLFHAEHSESEPLLVFVKPSASAFGVTNLLITTIGGRQFPFVLQPTGDVARADSSVDFLVVCRVATTSLIEEGDSNSTHQEQPRRAPVIAEDPLMRLIDGQRRRALSSPQGSRLKVAVGALIELESHFVVAFSVVNAAHEPIELMTPQIQLAGAVKSGLLKRNRRWITVDQLPVKEFHIDRRKLDPGVRTDGFVMFDRPALKQSNQRLLLQVADAAMVDQPVLVPIDFSISSSAEERYE